MNRANQDVANAKLDEVEELLTEIDKLDSELEQKLERADKLLGEVCELQDGKLYE